MTTRVQRITAYLGEYEEVIPASNSTFSRVQKIRPADDVALITTTPAAGGAVTNRTEYAHRDSLGSLDVVTDASRNVLTRTTFDPFGGRRESNWAGLDRSNHCCKKIDAQYPLQTNRRTAWTLTPWINRLNQRFQIGPRKYPIQRRQERFPFI